MSIKTYLEIASIVGHSINLVHKTLRDIEKIQGSKIYSDRNHDHYVKRRHYSPDFTNKRI